jgi:hypothetical protein
VSNLDGNHSDYAAMFATDEAATFYDNLYQSGSVDSYLFGLQKVQVIEFLTSVLNPTGEYTHFDFACGTGRWVNALSGYHKNQFGFDINQEMLRLAKMKCPNAILTGNLQLLEDKMVDSKNVIVTAFRFFLNTDLSGRESLFDSCRRIASTNDETWLILDIHGTSPSIRNFWIKLSNKVANNYSRRDFKKYVSENNFELKETLHVQYLPNSLLKFRVFISVNNLMVKYQFPIMSIWDTHILRIK